MPNQQQVVVKVDMLSDTVTLPTVAMLDAMGKAQLGDDGYGEDPTVLELEGKAAFLLGKSHACFFPSGVMANLCALLTHCRRGTEVLVGDQSDIYNYEAGGASVVGGLVMHPIRTLDNGELDFEELLLAFRDVTDHQCARAGVVCIENPHNLRGGRVLDLEYLKKVREISDRNGVPVHMDGARIFNAERASGIAASTFASFADSAQFCLSKSLSAPVGSMLVGSEDFIEEARRNRKMLGGSMRQAGVIASAGIVALDQMIERLDDDHHRAKIFAKFLSELDRIKCDDYTVETNMVFFSLEDTSRTAEFLQLLLSEGVRMSELGHGRIRAAIHSGIDDKQIEIAQTGIANALSKLT